MSCDNSQYKKGFCFESCISRLRNTSFKNIMETYEDQYGKLTNRIEDCAFYPYLKKFKPIPIYVKQEVEENIDTGLLCRLMGSFHRGEPAFRLLNEDDFIPEIKCTMMLEDLDDKSNKEPILRHYFSGKLSHEEAIKLMDIYILNLIGEYAFTMTEKEKKALKLKERKIIKKYREALGKVHLLMISNKAKVELNKIL